MSLRQEASPFQILAAGNAPDVEFHLELRNAVFFTVARKNEPAPATGFSVPIAALASPRTLELAKDAAKRLPAGASEFHWKIVGDPAALKDAAGLLRANGFPNVETKEKSGIWELLFYPESGRVRIASLAETDAVTSKADTSKTRVLIVDDSKTIRSLLEKVLSSDPEIEVVGAAEKPSDAEKMLQSLGKDRRPHVITLDIHMPEMDGVTFLKRYLPKHPIPTVMISSISLEEGPLVLSALEAGAVDYVQKPSFEQLKDVAPIILEKVKHARHAKIRISQRASPASKIAKKKSVGELCAAYSIGSPIVAIGSSTGGTEALREVFLSLPEEIPPMVVVQHIPPVFSKAFSDRMNELCPFVVKEASDGDAVVANQILIAPGGTQMSIVKAGNGFKVKVDPNANPVNRHKPSVDVLFDSVSELFGPYAIGVILTGMGADGAKGLLRMKQAGARTLGQNEATSVVYGMPRAAFEIGAVDQQLPIQKVAEAIMHLSATKKKAA